MIKFLSALLLILSSTAYAAVAISVDERATEIGSNILNSDRPSELPVAGFSEYFEQENINIIKDMDLSAYIGMKIFTGYGIYDSNQNNCQYVEVPGKSNEDFLNSFDSFHTYNKHSYGISKRSMNYSECSSFANAFGGTPVVIDSSAENLFIRKNFSRNKTSWVGTSITTCSDIYKSAINRSQTFFNFGEGDSQCSDYLKNVSIGSRGEWKKVSPNQIYSCVVEWDSPTYERPIKVCAPWWKVYREFQNKNIGLTSERELNRINQAEIPSKLNICVRYNEEAVEAQDTAVPRDVSCTSYYSATLAPECLTDIMQDQCFVDDCGGYIRNTCRLKEEDIVGKGYVKGQVIEGNEKVTIKVKDEVTTHIFTCPPSPHSQKSCLERASVIIYPQECSDSDCQKQRECLYEATDSAEENACYEAHKCVKIYASRDISPLLAPDGTILKLFGVCPDGEQLEFIPNIVDKDKKTCLEYEEIKKVTNVKEKCILNRNFTDHEINVALSDKDIYEDDENCLRIDTVEDSQKLTPVRLDITTKGYFKHKITKVNIDGTQEMLANKGSDSRLIEEVYGDIVENNLSMPPQSENNITTCGLDISCEEYQSQDYLLRNYAILMDGDNRDPNIENIDISTGAPFVEFYGISEDLCQSYHYSHGFASYYQSTEFEEDLDKGTQRCKIFLKTSPFDSFYSFIAMAGYEVQYIRRGQTTKEDCLVNALCVSGAFNESEFPGDWGSMGNCTIVSGEVPNEYREHLKEKSNCPVEKVSVSSECIPQENSETISSELDGLESILALEDYSGGEFGFYSNFRTTLPKSNIVSVSTDQISGKEIYPLIDISNTIDKQNYLAGITHISSRKKDINLDKGLVMVIAGPSALVNPIPEVLMYGLVLALVPTRAMDSQDMGWVVRKILNTDSLSPFENREQLLEDKNYGFDTFLSGGGSNYLYAHGESSIPRRDPGPFRGILEGVTGSKNFALSCSGYDDANIAKMTHGSETAILTGHPRCSFWNLWCEKKRTYTYTPRVDVEKTVNTVYMGATNSVTFLVPYQGDYTVEAYNKYDTLMSSVPLTKESFVNMDSQSKIRFAQVNFGQFMQLASGIPESSACTNDYMVEWGGGVSGAYYENGATELNTNCAKSNDDFVKDHSATRIVIKAGNVEGHNTEFSFDLTSPLPFANRVYIGTLDKKQVRRYRCYDEFGECPEESYKEDN